MILLVLAKTERIRGPSSINTQRTAIIFIRFLLSTNLFSRGETIFHLPPINILELFKNFLSSTRKYSKIFSPAELSWPQINNILETFKDFFACRIFLVSTHQYPGNIQKLSSKQKQSTAATSSSSNQQQQQQPAAATSSSSNQQQQPAAATSSSNQQQQSAAATSSSNQQQQPAAATSSSNQQQQSTAAINSSNQQQQSTTTTSSNNQHSSYQQHLHNQRRPPLVITTVTSSGYPASSWSRIRCPVVECNQRTEAYFCYFSTFLKSIFCDFSSFC